jgi:hypothetical protein
MHEVIELYDTQPQVKKINMEFKYSFYNPGIFGI